MAKQALVFESPFETYVESALLGQGGAGRVYEVKNDKGETFALKCLSPEKITSERRKRFKNEIGFCQRVNHKNIVRVVDTGTIEVKGTRCPFYVMQRYGGTLRGLLASPSHQQPLGLFAQVLDGVDAAHKLGVWHRDLKPENVLWDQAQRVLVVADFGIAHFEVDDIYTAVETNVASRMANFLYSAPEQRVRGARVDHRADLFSLGLLLNELFTREVPQGTGYRTIESTSPDFSYLDPIVDRLLQNSPENRYQSVEELKADLIGHKNAFVALQKLNEEQNQVVRSSDPPAFEPIRIVNIDFSSDTLTLELNRNVPSGWPQEFQQPRGGHSFMMGYGPEAFKVQGTKLTVRARGEETFLQSLVNHAKAYVDAANKGYVLQQQELAARQEYAARQAHEKRIADAKLRANILKNVKL